jgi:hypothetical protein
MPLSVHLIRRVPSVIHGIVLLALVLSDGVALLLNPHRSV